MSAPIDWAKVVEVLGSLGPACNYTGRCNSGRCPLHSARGVEKLHALQAAAKLCEAMPAIEALLELCNGPEHNDDTGYVDFHAWLDTLRHEAQRVRESIKRFPNARRRCRRCTPRWPGRVRAGGALTRFSGQTVTGYTRPASPSGLGMTGQSVSLARGSSRCSCCCQASACGSRCRAMWSTHSSAARICSNDAVAAVGVALLAATVGSLLQPWVAILIFGWTTLLLCYIVSK